MFSTYFYLLVTLAQESGDRFGSTSLRRVSATDLKP